MKAPMHTCTVCHEPIANPRLALVEFTTPAHEAGPVAFKHKSCAPALCPEHGDWELTRYLEWVAAQGHVTAE